MKLSDVLAENPELSGVVDAISSVDGITEFYPPQAEAVKNGLLGDGNLILSFSTASGKTLCAELAMHKIIKQGGKAVYTCPLRAIATEKYNEFRKKYKDLGLKIGISIGDLDSTDPWLGDYDIIITTFEKLDSLIRHSASWLALVKMLVVDEVHILDSVDRGPTVEMLVTKFRHMFPKTRILALSATIGNTQELAGWLGAKCISSSWRPIPLYRGVYLDGVVEFDGKKQVKPWGKSKDATLLLAEHAISEGGQSIIFVNSRRSAESVAEKAAKTGMSVASEKELEKLADISSKILNSLESPTTQCRKLAECVKCGAAFHHSGLTNEQRGLVEGAFKKGLVKVISATPTLAAGVNLPSRRVVIRDVHRYSDYGLTYIPVLEYAQMAGRAGRPGLDPYGEAILVAKSEQEKEDMLENYVRGDIEQIYSKIGVLPVLRMHTLGLIASVKEMKKAQLLDFFHKTFFAYQYGDTTQLDVQLNSVLKELERYSFVAEKAGSYAATPLGSRVSELYLDPETAKNIVDQISRVPGTKTSAFSYLMAATKGVEMRPFAPVKNKEVSGLVVECCSRADEMLEPVGGSDDFVSASNYNDDPLLPARYKTARMMEDWIEELGEEGIAEKYGVPPGILRAKIEKMDWLLYSISEISKILKVQKSFKDAEHLRTRLKYGVKEELAVLVQLRGIGRVRARLLFNAGMRTMRELKLADLEIIAHVIGRAQAISVKEQLGVKVDKQEKKGDMERGGQGILGHPVE